MEEQGQNPERGDDVDCIPSVTYASSEECLDRQNQPRYIAGKQHKQSEVAQPLGEGEHVGPINQPMTDDIPEDRNKEDQPGKRVKEDEDLVREAER